VAQGSFEAALALILDQEGGFADHPADPGGPTKFGITQATLARRLGRPVSADQVRRLGPAEVRAIYREHYWNAVRADDLPSGIDVAVFDCAVNSGPGRAARLLQKALDVPVDGVVGPVTLAAARNGSPTHIIRTMTEARLAFLERLPTWPVFGRGWRKRVLAVQRAALERAAGLSSLPQQTSSFPQQKGRSMYESKPILASRTVWTNLTGLLAVALGVFGFDPAALDADAFAEAAVQLVAAGSFIASTIFRIVAPKQLLS
jgi:lysozyme family protein